MFQRRTFDVIEQHALDRPGAFVVDHVQIPREELPL